jgi:periplasmic divalent cation tolerance protein
MVFAYTTVSTKEEAKEIVLQLIADKLISCANFFECSSIYASDDGADSTEEVIILMKTEENMFGEVKDEICKLHPYKLPAIIKIPMEVDSDYAVWMDRQLK